MKKLAIIGLGPRGLYALENVLKHLNTVKKQVHILVFEPSNKPGAGPVWNEYQDVSNWINITERALEGIKARPEINYDNIRIKQFPSYHQWCDFSQGANAADKFPPRAKMGKYLNARFESLRSHLIDSESFTFINSKVNNLDVKDEKINIETDNDHFSTDNVLLTIGHQPTKISDQIKAWKTHVSNTTNLSIYEDPYPVSQFNSLKNQLDIKVGLRGFGLAMIDVMRYLVINNYGNFKVINQNTLETVYYKTKSQQLKLVPFSLDGLPLGPKPLNEKIDSWYQPTQNELTFFKSEIETVAKTKANTNTIDFLISPMSKIAARVFNDLNEKALINTYNVSEIETIISKFLSDAIYKHQLLQETTIPTYKLIQKYVDMALGKTKVSLDYCVWQVWRHCQPTLYKAFSYAKVQDAIIKKVITLDERSKRFSYGPPLESMQQILALVDADVLTLDYVNNPDIELITNGWKLTNEHKNTITTSTMINSVLDAPKLLDVDARLIKNLLHNNIIKPKHSALGIDTNDNAYIVSNIETNKASIAVLGRLAKGSVIGVDAILECFGPRIENWAKAYVEKLYA